MGTAYFWCIDTCAGKNTYTNDDDDDDDDDILKNLDKFLATGVLSHSDIGWLLN